jgi:hypothetical protein
MKALRQGDVMLFPSVIPVNSKKTTMKPLALGEVTGHHHSLMVANGLIDDSAELYEAEDGTLYCRIKDEGVLLTHQEHKAQNVSAGDYQVVIQQENTSWGARPVAD